MATLPAPRGTQGKHLDKIYIYGISCQGIIGIQPDERTGPREITVDVELFADLRPAGESDTLEDTINYAVIVKTVRAIVGSAQRYTIEALSEDIARVCLQNPRAQQVMVRVQKPGVLPGVNTVGVEIIRKRG